MSSLMMISSTVESVDRVNPANGFVQSNSTEPASPVFVLRNVRRLRRQVILDEDDEDDRGKAKASPGRK